MKRYYSLYQNVDTKTVDIYIYGDITSWEWSESDVSSYTLSRELQSLGEEIEYINVYINSYGGEVSEGIAIHNMLKRHKAKVTTCIDSFACSIATVIFAAGDERIVYNTSMGFYHNAWTYIGGNANELRKEADDLEKITQASINAYMDCVNINEEKLKKILDGETWLNANEMLEMGFATKVIKAEETNSVSQSARKSLMQKITEQHKNDTIKVQIDVDKLDMEQLAENLIQKLQEKQSQEQTINKPLNMMKAFFNARKEQ
jgi:ATP-dependent Clp protease protease subunit